MKTKTIITDEVEYRIQYQWKKKWLDYSLAITAKYARYILKILKEEYPKCKQRVLIRKTKTTVEISSMTLT